MRLCLSFYVDLKSGFQFYCAVGWPDCDLLKPAFYNEYSVPPEQGYIFIVIYRGDACTCKQYAEENGAAHGKRDGDQPICLIPTEKYPGKPDDPLPVL